MKKILCGMLFGLSSMSAFATIGDTPYTLAQNEKLTQSIFKVTLNKGDGVTNIWFDDHKNQPDQTTGLDADNTYNDVKDQSRHVSVIPYSDRGTTSYDQDGNLKISWIDNSGSTTYQEIADNFYASANNVLFYHDGVNNGYAYFDLLTRDIQPKNAYFNFKGYLNINGEALGKLFFLMAPYNASNVWLLTFDEVKNVVKVNGALHYVAVRSDKGNCYVFQGIGNKPTGTYSTFNVTQNNTGNYCEGLLPYAGNK